MNPPLPDLPDDCWYCILAFVRPAELLKVSLVCRRFAVLASEQRGWDRLVPGTSALQGIDRRAAVLSVFRYLDDAARTRAASPPVLTHVWSAPEVPVSTSGGCSRNAPPLAAVCVSDVAIATWDRFVVHAQRVHCSPPLQPGSGGSGSGAGGGVGSVGAGQPSDTRLVLRTLAATDTSTPGAWSYAPAPYGCDLLVERQLAGVRPALSHLAMLPTARETPIALLPCLYQEQDPWAGCRPQLVLIPLGDGDGGGGGRPSTGLSMLRIPHEVGPVGPVASVPGYPSVLHAVAGRAVVTLDLECMRAVHTFPAKHAPQCVVTWGEHVVALGLPHGGLTLLVDTRTHRVVQRMICQAVSSVSSLVLNDASVFACSSVTCGLAAFDRRMGSSLPLAVRKLMRAGRTARTLQLCGVDRQRPYVYLSSQPLPGCSINWLCRVGLDCDWPADAVDMMMEPMGNPSLARTPLLIPSVMRSLCDDIDISCMSAVVPHGPAAVFATRTRVWTLTVDP